MDSIANDILDIKTALAVLQTNNVANCFDAEEKAVEEKQPEEVSQLNLNASLASVEEFIDEPLNTSTEALNCQDPTNLLK